uniref:Integrase catalytic domain-containing protein n=1 Tax=Haptolina brevifila TaxID=156173 RepID=A0A7S2E0K0_9EUKA|mmetsp:Transcript_45806/g.91364  ORF Transcript_45806/g.91364 Transcript_45806/m.91364 type:complete len:1022 (+) Transcript_45806:1972-5037(+)
MQGKNATDDDRFMSWTKRCCGLSPEAVSHLQENSVGCDAPNKVPSQYKDLKWWPSAIAGKMRAPSHPAREHPEITAFRQVVAMDFLEFTINGKKMHVHAFIDYHSTHAFAVVVKSRSTAHQNVMQYLNSTEEYVQGSTVMRMQHDRAKEYLSNRMKGVTVYSQVVQYATVPYQHTQQAKIERFNQTIQRMVIVSMHDSNLPMVYVVYVIEFCVRVYNLVPVRSLEWKSRTEVAFGFKPDFSNIFRIGCLCRVLKPLEKRTHKFDTHAQDCVYLGPCPLGGGARYLPLDTRRVLVRRDVVVYGDVMPLRKSATHNVCVQSSRADQQDVASDIAWWEPDGATMGGEELAANATPQTARMQQNIAAESSSPVPINTMHSQASDADRHEQFTPSPGGTATRAYSPFSPQRITPQVRNMWGEGRCSNTQCTLPPNHPGDCNNTTGFHPHVPEVPSVPPSGATRGARQGKQAQGMPTVTEQEGEDMPGDEEVIVDAQMVHVLHTAYTAPVKTHLSEDPCGSPTPSMEYGTCIDALTASVEMSELIPQTHGGGSGVFDMTLPEPTTIAEAQASPNWDVPNGYKTAVEKEAGSWIHHEVLRNATEAPPPNIDVVNLRTMFSVKKDKKGHFKKAKLRIIVLCHKHVAERGQHFFENFSQTVRWPNLRAICAQACLEGFTVAEQWDTSTAFLYEKLEPGARVLVRVPLELQDRFGVGGYAWVDKAAYGVPGAPRGFYKFAKALLTNKDKGKCNCTCSEQDESVFVRRRGDKFVFIAIWVDDFIVLSNCEKLCSEVREGYFGTVTGECGSLDYCLGVNFIVSRQDQSIQLTSETTIDSIVQRFGTPIRSVSTPAVEASADLMHEPLPEVNSPLWQRLRPRAERYRSQVPAMLYANTTTRPDISWIIGVCCRCLDNPSERHLDAADYCMAYLYATKEMGVKYGGVRMQSTKFTDLQVTYSPLKDQLESLSDSDWSTGKSVSGFVLLLALGAIMWASKKQAVTSLSSAEAEYYAASACGAVNAGEICRDVAESF